VTLDPVRKILAECGVRKGVGAGAQRGYEKRSRSGFPRFAIVDRKGGTGPVNEDFVARTMLLTQHRVLLAPPALVQLAEATVAISLGLALAILFPEQL